MGKAKIANSLGRSVAGEGRWGSGANPRLGACRELDLRAPGRGRGWERFAKRTAHMGVGGSMAVSCWFNSLLCDPKKPL